MDGPPTILISNESVPETDIDSSNIIDKLEELGSATWHPLFIRDYYEGVLTYVKKNVKYDSPNDDNKWGYQYHISKFLKTIQLNLDDFISVKNYIVSEEFTYFYRDGKNYYSVRKPRSVYEIFWSWIVNFNLDPDLWDEPELQSLKDIHLKFKERRNQYTFFTIDEEELDTLTNSYLYLVGKKNN
tara:strand:- start:865 stop:1419 length:555 start_codon:yes stop_codon:yes gene_type:complete